MFVLSPSNVPWNQCLFPVMKPHFYAAGHAFTANIEDTDCFLIDLHVRQFDYKQEEIDYCVMSGKPVVTFDEWDRGGMSSDEWPFPLTLQQGQLFVFNWGSGKMNVSEDENSIHFCRLFDKTNQSIKNLYPYEKPYSYEEPLLTPEQLFERPFDICYIANTSPSREAIAKALREDGRLKCDILLGGKKLEWVDFLKRHKQAKLFISSGAGGFTDERVQCLFSVAGVIRERSNQLLLHDFTHGVDCLRVDNPPTKKDLDEIYEVVNDKERLYDIYKTGYDFVKKYYSSEYISNNILEIIKKHGLI